MGKKSKSKQTTSSVSTVTTHVTETSEPPNEEKSEVPEIAIGDKKLQRQQEKLAREEEEKKKWEEKAKQDKINAAKKKTKKPATRAQKTSEPISEPKSKEDTPVKVQNSSGDWNIQRKGEHVSLENVSDEIKKVEESTAHSYQGDWGSADNSYPESPSKLLPNDSLDATSSTQYKRSWGHRTNSFQNPNSSVFSNTDANNRQYDSDQKKSYNQRDNYPKREIYNRERNYDSKQKFGEQNYRSQNNYGKYDERSYNYNMSSYGYSRFNDKNDHEFQAFIDLTHKRPTINHGKLFEKRGDLFTASEDYSLAHCVAEDMSMGAGIAKTFRSQFGKVGFLLNQRQRTGGLAVLHDNNRYIYYLITKEVSRGKPTLYTLWLSLVKLKQHIQKNNVSKLAIPQIGCGLDRLEWNMVQQMLEHIFQDIDIEILVYIWDETVEETPQKLLKKCSVVHVQMELIDIEPGTGLVYFGTVDGFESDAIKSLSTKYNLNTYKTSKKLGDVINTVDKKEYLYGLIIKNSNNDEADYEEIEKALRTLRNTLKKDKTNYIGFQAFIDKNDKLLLDKIIALMQYIFLDVEIWICWPDAIKNQCPQQNRTYY